MRASGKHSGPKPWCIMHDRPRYYVRGRGKRRCWVRMQGHRIACIWVMLTGEEIQQWRMAINPPDTRRTHAQG